MMPRDELEDLVALERRRGRTLLVGLLFLGIGFGLVAPPLALIVPGAVLTAIALGFGFSRRGPGRTEELQ